MNISSGEKSRMKNQCAFCVLMTVVILGIRQLSAVESTNKGDQIQTVPPSRALVSPVRKESDVGHYTVEMWSIWSTSPISLLECQCGNVYALPACNVKPPEGGGRFVGWACSNGKRYDDGMLIYNLAQAGETVSMTALWEGVPTPSKTVLYCYDDDDRLVDTRMGNGGFTSELTPAGNAKVIKEASGK